MPTVVAVFAGGAGILVMAVIVVITGTVLDGAWWGYFIGGMAEVTVTVLIIRLAMGRLPLRPWVLRLLGREK